MELISEIVNKYYFVATKVIKTIEDDNKGYLLETKKVYVMGIKVFQLSKYRKRSLRDSVMYAWGSRLQWKNYGEYQHYYWY